MEIKDIIIPGYTPFVKITPINKGVSLNKSRVETVDGTRYLLDVNDASEYGRKKSVFDVMSIAAERGVPMCRPVEIGLCGGGEKVYQLMTWIDGRDLDQALPALSEADQYAVGLQSGGILRKLHSVPAPAGLEDWHDKYVNLYESRIKLFDSCGVKIDGSDEILRYYEDNKRLMKGRPQCLRHGDYHTGNLLVTDNLDLFVIDWDLMEYGANYGDPWEEFNRIDHMDVIPHYTTGLIRGYFGGEPPARFWDLLALYLSATALMLVVWAFYIVKEKSCQDNCVQTAKNAVVWFDKMRNTTPAWYLKEL